MRAFVFAAVLLCGACVIDAPESAVSRFSLAWDFAGGVSCEDIGAQRVRLESTLRGDVTPEVFVDEFPCDADVGRTRPLEPGPYDVQLVAIGAGGDTVGMSELRSGVELANEVTVELAPFTIEPTGAPARRASGSDLGARLRADGALPTF